MTGVIRSLVFLFLAIFVAGTLAISAAPLKAETSGAMAAMPMTSGTANCKTCDPQMDMAASCTLTCALSSAGVLAGPVHYGTLLADCRFDIADVTAKGLSPQPAFTPPRTNILI